MLRDAAEAARQDAIRKMESRRIGHLKGNRKSLADAMDLLIDDVRDEKRGAFAVLSQYPWLAAIILPSSGLGAWALLEYFARSI